MSQATERMKHFAEENRLHLTDTGAERVVPGKYGELADMEDEGMLRLRLLAVPRSAKMDRTLRARRAKAMAAGLTCKWQGEAEAIFYFYFDPANEAHVQLAVKLVGAKRKRVRILTEEQKEALVARLAASRKLPQAA